MTATRNPTYYEGDLRRDLLDGALAVIEAEGTSALSLRAVARRVGVSHAAPKNHFEDKTALFTAIAIEGFQGLGAAMSAAISDAPDPVSAARASGVAYVRYAIANPAHFRVMWRNELLGEDPLLEEAGAHAFGALVAVAERAQATGWGAQVAPDDIAAIAWTCVHGLAQLWLDGPLAEIDGRSIDELTEAVTRAIVDVFGRPPQRRT